MHLFLTIATDGEEW